jgi:hypothetical protein
MQPKTISDCNRIDNSRPTVSFAIMKLDTPILSRRRRTIVRGVFVRAGQRVI